MVSVGLIGLTPQIIPYMTALKGMKGYDVCGCYSSDYEKTSALVNPFRTVVFKTPEALLNFSDLIVITGDKASPFMLAAQAIRALKHVLLCHPENLKTQEIKELLKLAEESGTQVLFGEGYSSHPFFRIIQERMSRPFWIEMSRGIGCESETLRAELAGYLRKDIEFLLECTGGEILKASAKPCSFSGTEGAVGCQLEMNTGCVLSLNYFVHPPSGNHLLKIHQPGSVLTADFGKNILLAEQVGPDSGPLETLQSEHDPEQLRRKEIQALIHAVSETGSDRFGENIRAILLTCGLMTKFKLPVYSPPGTSQKKGLL